MVYWVDDQVRLWAPVSLEFFTLSFRDPRDQLRQMGRTSTRVASEIAESLAGGSVRHLGYGSLRRVLEEPSSTQLALAVTDDCLLVVTVDLPGRSLQWGDLAERHPEIPISEARMVGHYPASDGFEFELRNPQTQRHLSSSSGVVEIDDGRMLGFESAVASTQTVAAEEEADDYDYDYDYDMFQSALATMFGLDYENPPRELWVHRFGGVTAGVGASGRDQAFPPGRHLTEVVEDARAAEPLRAQLDTSYFFVQPVVADGEASEQVVVHRPGGQVILDFDQHGRFLGIEVLGARSLLSDETIRSVDSRVDPETER